MAQLPHYLLTIDDSGDLGIQETSFVEYPATGLSFLAFEEEKVEHKFARIDEQKYQRLVSGVMMMPNTKYLRQTKEGSFYTVEFSADTLKQALVKYLKEDKAGVVKVEHQGRALSGFSAVEHWIIEDANTKSPVLGYSLGDLGYNPAEIPAGTIMKTTYVADEKFWNDQIMSGKVQGYSLGGLFELKQVEDQTQQFSTNPQIPTIQDVLKLIGVEGDNIKVTSKEGKQLQFGQTVSEGNELANGTYEFNTDLKIVVKDGVIVDYGFDKENDNKENTIEMSDVQTQPTDTNVQVTTETTPNVTTETNVSTETTNVTTETTPNVTPVVPEQNISAPTNAQIDELNAKLDSLTSQLSEKDSKINELETKLAKLDEKNQTLKEKLKEEPVKKSPVSHKQPFGGETKTTGKTTLKIGNQTITV